MESHNKWLTYAHTAHIFLPRSGRMCVWEGGECSLVLLSIWRFLLVSFVYFSTAIIRRFWLFVFVVLVLKDIIKTFFIFKSGVTYRLSTLIYLRFLRLTPSHRWPPCVLKYVHLSCKGFFPFAFFSTFKWQVFFQNQMGNSQY